MSSPQSFPRPPRTRPAPTRNHRRRRAVALAMSAALLLTLMLSGGAAASTMPMGWHRLNVHSDPAEHERFGCLADEVWRCHYDKLPEPVLGLAWDQTRGSFVGTDTTADWSCPTWFPGDACDAADTVVSGVMTFVPPRSGDSFDVDQQLLVADDGTLWIYWTDQFVCPWYPTFAETFESEASCTFAPDLN
jgi:hypothetical protein